MVWFHLFLQAINLLSPNYLFPFLTIFPHFFIIFCWMFRHYWSSHTHLFPPPNKFLIASDSMPSIQSSVSYPFNPCFSPLIIFIKIILFSLNQANFTKIPLGSKLLSYPRQRDRRQLSKVHFYHLSALFL